MGLNLLDERRLRIASRVSNVDNERYPDVVNNGLFVEVIEQGDVSMGVTAASTVVT